MLTGAAPVVAWAVKNTFPELLEPGLVAAVEGKSAYINKGKSDGVRVGQKFKVYKESDEIKDPATGESLGAVQQLIGEFQAADVQERITKIDPLGESKPLSVGDSAISDQPEKNIAVLPLKDSEGEVSIAGQKFAEEMMVHLARLHAPMVERAKLDDVLDELSLEKTRLVDDSTEKKVGKLIGAFAIVTGEIKPEKFVDVYNVRLVEVETGKIRSATTIRIKRDDSIKAVRKPEEIGWLTTSEQEEREGGVMYLSELKPLNVEVYKIFGTNGQHGDNDKISIGKAFPRKGLSTHPDPRKKGAYVVYELPANDYRLFRTVVAIHDSVGNRIKTPLVFEVWGDHTLLWQSNPIRTSFDIQECRVKIKGVKRLELRVNCPGSTEFAWAVWGDPRLSRK
ncbi:MAG: NPCBM/NEW2 domain-containing protein [Planctomycetaceae bacterium]|nr:NPCBM/NEW2 domain-containing protein [Planctomycetaceae bacterium]